MNGPIVLDTNVLSYASRDWRWRDVVNHMVARYRAIISFQTHEELLQGAIKASWSRDRIQELQRFLAPFELRHSDDELVWRCASLRADQANSGRTLTMADAWIVATALVLDCPLVTEDQRLKAAQVPGLTLVEVVIDPAPDAPA